MPADKNSRLQIRFYVNFGGRAREAMDAYHRLLGGRLDHQQGQFTLEVDGVVILGVDGHPDYPAKTGENMALSAASTDKDRITKIFDGLSEGGMVKMPLKAQGGLGEVGWLTDKFGINWTVSVDKG